MFNNLVECAKTKKDNKRWNYFVATSAIWSLALAGTVIGGIFLYDAKLDEQLSLLTLINPVPPAASPAAKAVKPNINNSAPKYAPPDINVRESPKEISSDVTNKPTTRLVSSGSPTGDFSDLPIGDNEVGDGPGLIPGLGGPGSDVDVPAPKEFEAKELKVAEPKAEAVVPPVIRRSEGVIRGNTITQVKPEYPQLARTTNITGEVKIDILIGEDGSVVSANVMSGHPLLQQAALKAAKGWRFKPTTLSGAPVKVQGVLTFRFIL